MSTRQSWLPQRPWSITPSRPTMGLITNTYTRSLTYGQINGIKGVLKLMKKLKVSKKLVDVAFNQTNFGQPGSADTYRVRIRYNE